MQQPVLYVFVCVVANFKFFDLQDAPIENNRLVKIIYLCMQF